MSGSPDPSRADLLRDSLTAVAGAANDLVSHFYALLFLQRPDLRALFPPAMDLQRDRLLTALLRLGTGSDEPHELRRFLRQLGRDHRKYGVLDDHYPAVGTALIGALARYLGPRWTAELQAAWVEVYTWASDVMIEAAADDAEEAPPWWDAVITGHERRAQNIAVLTVEPDRPLPYHPGQHVTIETPWWPRVWRQYSIANAPRVDGRLELHVRAVPAGWVSNALVYRARVGDHIRLGPARGGLVLRGETLRRALCVASGTGLAPIKALVQHMAQRQLANRAYVFIGAKYGADLYDLHALSAMADVYPWLKVIPAVTHDRSFAGDQGALPDVLARYGFWHDHDVFVSGSAAMVRATTHRLTGELGVAPQRLHTESPDAIAQGSPGLLQGC
ncbi:globin domain-containing protein [Embleya sp. NBC_00896]|uniref:globin domain-containing protein n=1 Tax=Embleya sp. NBC_00896 TaxID=2975961 RepID=UPI00386CB713|nr:FAD-binding oxidoreductase [Embleya sp. NBC_00896]